MATPKKKVSKSRRNMRRFAAGNKLGKTTITPCSACGEITRPHRVCKCGAYNGKQVLPAKSVAAQA